MNTRRKTAIMVGILFLMAMVTSLVGAGLIESASGAPDYLQEVANKETLVRSGVILELINGIAVVGIAVLMFPLLKQYHEGLALGYVGFRMVEAVIIVAALITPLMLITISQNFMTAEAQEATQFQAIGETILTMRTFLVGQLLGIFFGLGAFIFYYLLHRLNLVPRIITWWGLVATVLILVWNSLELLGLHVQAGIVFGLPIILNEIFLGIWLIAKGFNTLEVASRPVQPAMTAR